MLHIKIIGAENLPLIPEKLKKTRISCFSYSSYRYFYGTFKSKEKATSPEFDCEFDVDLFRAISLTFSLHSTSDSINVPVSLIGHVNIALSWFLTQGAGAKVLTKPGTTYQFKFAIVSSISKNAFLALQMTYSPKEYETIPTNQFPELPIVHLWSTYSPSIEGQSKTPVEVELFQAYPLDNPKPKTRLGYYYHLNSKCSWESVGKSSTSTAILGPCGLTQIHSFSLPKIQGKFNFLILNVGDYNGVITLNFVGEQKGKITNLGDSNYINLQESNNLQVGTIRTIDIKVEANTKYCCPIYLYYDNLRGKNVFSINEVPQICNRYKSDESLAEPDKIYTQSEFESKIIEEYTPIIPGWTDIIFNKISVLPKTETVPLATVFQNYGLEPDYNNLRLYLGSSNTFNQGGSPQTDTWSPIFIVYDKSTGAKCPEVAEELGNRPSLEFSTSFYSKSPLHFKFNSYVKLDLSKYSKDKVIIFAMKSNTTGKCAPHGIYLLTYANGDDETMFFRNPFSAGSPKIHYVVLFRLEYINDDWCIVPMRYYFREDKKMAKTLDSMYLNRWNLSLTTSQINETFISDSDDDTSLIISPKKK